MVASAASRNVRIDCARISSLCAMKRMFRYSGRLVSNALSHVFPSPVAMTTSPAVLPASPRRLQLPEHFLLDDVRRRRRPHGLRDWDLTLSAHMKKAMEDRGFTEVDLRRMLEDAIGYREDVVEGRWVVETRQARAKWEVIVEPDKRSPRLVVVTAYDVGR